MEITEILVGIDGSEESADAVRWGASCAARRDVPLVLVSSYALPVVQRSSQVDNQVSKSNLISGDDFKMDSKRMCESVLADAENIARISAAGIGRVRMRTVLWSDSILSTLLRVADRSTLVVLGSPTEVRSNKISECGCSVVAARARGPVVVVRNDNHWKRSAPVVAGIDDSAVSDLILQIACEEALLRGVDLLVVYSWCDLDLTFFGADCDSSEVGSPLNIIEFASVNDRLIKWSAKFPELSIKGISVRDCPSRTLISAGESAQLVVVGRRGRGGYSGMFLGSTSADLLSVLVCPLMFVDYSF